MDTPQFPSKPGLTDLAQSLISAGAETLLSLGMPPEYAHSIVEVATQYLPAPLQRRQERFFNDLAAEVRRLELRVDDLPFAKSEEFAAFATSTLRSVTESVEAARIAMLRNALVNGVQGSAHRLGILKQLLDDLTVDHVLVLREFSTAHPGVNLRPFYLAEDAAAFVAKQCPRLGEGQGYCEKLFRDVWTRSLLAFPHSTPGVLGPGQEKVYTLDGPRLSAVGQSFVAFISEPQPWTPSNP